MARRFRRSRAIYNNRKVYISRARSFGRKAYNKSGLNLNMPFLAGAAAAFVVPDNEMLNAGAILGATAPVKGLGKIKGAAQGYLFGQFVQHFVLPKLGINIGNVMGGNSASGNVI